MLQVKVSPFAFQETVEYDPEDNIITIPPNDVNIREGTLLYTEIKKHTTEQVIIHTHKILMATAEDDFDTMYETREYIANTNADGTFANEHCVVIDHPFWMNTIQDLNDLYIHPYNTEAHMALGRESLPKHKTDNVWVCGNNVIYIRTHNIWIPLSERHKKALAKRMKGAVGQEVRMFLGIKEDPAP
ncbi:hypothetical protein D3C78_17670 [compost metagenome]